MIKKHIYCKTHENNSFVINLKYRQNVGMKGWVKNKILLMKKNKERMHMDVDVDVDGYWVYGHCEY